MEQDMDEKTTNHLIVWLDHDYKDMREEALAMFTKINDFVREHPGVLETHSWPEVRACIERAERRKLNPKYMNWRILLDDANNRLVDFNCKPCHTLREAYHELMDIIGSGCECDNTHEQNNTTCCLCEYRTALDGTKRGPIK
jgi:hypothetical protein